MFAIDSLARDTHCLYPTFCSNTVCFKNADIRYNSDMITATNEKVLNELAGIHAPVNKWEVDTGTDATGENAVWVWAIVDDANLLHLSQEARARLRDSIRAAVSRSAESPVPSVYIRFRATSEV